MYYPEKLFSSVGRIIKISPRYLGLLIFAGVSRVLLSEQTDPLVTLGGKAVVRGYKTYTDQSDKPVYTFTGVPYAQKPVRFLKAATLKLWNGQKDATKMGKACFQNEVLLRDIYPKLFSKVNFTNYMSEDCLFLNIWTPSLNDRSRRDVMVWIHGGAFLTGSGSEFQGTALASIHDVVHVSINYRLAGLGFLTTGDENAPGNMAFHDQLEALRWVKRYIHKFGGEPEKVTICGESAGSMSVSLHMVSPLSRNLFKRAISESGTSLQLQPYTFNNLPAGIELTKKLAEKHGCPLQNTKSMMDCLRTKQATVFVQLGDIYSPLVDGALLPDTPYNLYSTGRIHPKEYLLGFNSHEGHRLLSIMVPLAAKLTPFQLSLQNLTTSSAKSITMAAVVPFYGLNLQIIETAFNEYIGSKKTQLSLLKGLLSLFGDFLMTAPILDAARKHSEKQKTYVYSINYKVESSSHPRPKWVLTDHGDEVPFVLGYPFFKFLPVNLGEQKNYTSNDKKLSELMMSYWTNFAKTGNPNAKGLPHWPQYDCKAKKYLLLNNAPSVASDYMPQRMKLWMDIVPRMDTNRVYKGLPWKCNGSHAAENAAFVISIQFGTLSLLLISGMVIRTA